MNKKQFKSTVWFHEQEAKEFEDTLVKLSDQVKGKVKLSEFGPRDKMNLLDLFVNNEKILLKVYESLFPSSANPFSAAPVAPKTPVEEPSGSIFEDGNEGLP